MSTTALIALLLGTALAPVFLVKAFAAQDDHTASVCGVIALAAFLGAVALARLIVRTAVSR